MNTERFIKSIFCWVAVILAAITVMQIFECCLMGIVMFGSLTAMFSFVSYKMLEGESNEEIKKIININLD